MRSGRLVEGDFERGAGLDDQGTGWVGEDPITIGHVVSGDIVEVINEFLEWRLGVRHTGKREGTDCPAAARPKALRSEALSPMAAVAADILSVQRLTFREVCFYCGEERDVEGYGERQRIAARPGFPGMYLFNRGKVRLLGVKGSQQ